MKGTFPTERFKDIQTPFYYYDTDLLRNTLEAIKAETGRHENFIVHYAVKANANPQLLTIIKNAGLGADCVSGGEIEAALAAGFTPSSIVYAGVGKSDWEINLALDKNIFCFNVESVPELEVINNLAASKGKTANVAFRINPNVGAHTHANITTGLAENKFGIAMRDMKDIIAKASKMENVKFIGLHFHIGSQILDMTDFLALCNRINEIQDELENRHIRIENINVGGGLGIDYEHPDRVAIPDFKSYFNTYERHLKLRPGQHVHFELGRSVVAQCGSLITKTLYIKQGATKQFAIVDAGMTDLIRPALYQAYHKIENISSDGPHEEYDIVGPICESSDVFAKQTVLNRTKRGDLLAIRSAGAYGEIMASQYNCRKLPRSYTSDGMRQGTLS
ncbi:diaminopimelate decarboxylase [Xylanibacter muris]|uniref:Diaminopimelate decarboxylase n=1 Tax=Xylanibacter muris TaxID=2736290 RepID=A0ABX2AMX5_9BACT|nr:diaminopimelate decarboxylase [Xylanibacter muris]NPD91387.1 diaminopimelate decarboxylase [Xylanibacter muris]